MQASGGTFPLRVLPPALAHPHSTTEKYLSVADHRLLCDRISHHFSAYHQVVLAYQIPIKVPLASSSVKHQIRSLACSVINKHHGWSVHLHTYLKPRACVITAKTLTVGDVLLSLDSTKLPSGILTAGDHCECLCKHWPHLPGVTMHHKTSPRTTPPKTTRYATRWSHVAWVLGQKHCRCGRRRYQQREHRAHRQSNRPKST